MPECLAVILGSGFTDIAAAGDAAPVATRYGEPSAPARRYRLGGRELLTLARHGEDHALPPHTINYRANIAALQALGATAIVGMNTVGVIGGIRAGGEIAVPDQLIDYTWGRRHTFADGDGREVLHVDFTTPFSPPLRAALLGAAARAGVDCHDGGVYAVTQGPRLETAAEVDRLERDGADYVGMTAMPEAALAAEAGIDYACIALVVNRAAGRGDRPIHQDVAANSAAARSLAMRVLEALQAGDGG